MNNSIWILVLVAVCIGTVLLARVYVRKQLLKVEQMLSISAKELKQGKYCLDETINSKLYQRLGDLYHSLEVEYARADGEKESVKAYIADLSHQMKTPLSNIKLYADLMAETKLTEAERAEFICKIGFESNKIEWILKALTKITRLESGAISFNIQDKDLKETVQESIYAVQGQAEEKKIHLKLIISEEVVIWHNKRWTMEALVNILENALKYSPENSLITISMDILEYYVVINIQDEGIGIEKADYQNIFKRFYRGKNAGGMPGSGLGLYLAQLICNLQDGYVLVRSEIGKGSVFSVYLKR